MIIMTLNFFNHLLSFLKEKNNFECLWNQFIWARWLEATIAILLVFQGEEECHTIDTNIGVEGHLCKI
jgi:hypothetical protein